MLQAMNTGHDGSLTTLHANTPRDALSRLETMVAMADLNLPQRAVRAQISSAIDIVIQVSRLSDGTRRVKQVTEIVGMEGDVITMQDIFMFEQTDVADDGRVLGRLRPTGIRPKCLDRLAAQGFRMAGDAFADLPVARTA
jgi:pilus assembly protein CpaF